MELNIKQIREKNISKINEILEKIDENKFTESIYFFDDEIRREFFLYNQMKYLKDFVVHEREFDFEEINEIIDFLIFDVKIAVCKTPSFLYQNKPYALSNHILNLDNKKEIIEFERNLNKTGLMSCGRYFRDLKMFAGKESSIILSKTKIPIDKKELVKLRFKQNDQYKQHSI